MNSDIFNQDDFDFIWEEHSGCWVDSIYYAGCEIFEKKFNREPTCEESAEIFLALFKRLVDEGIILVLPPVKGEPTKKAPNDIANDDFWDVSSDKMIEYIRSVLPKDLRYLENNIYDENEPIQYDKWYEWYDEKTQIRHVSNVKNDLWGKFWYSDCPWIRWVDKTDGKVY